MVSPFHIPSSPPFAWLLVEDMYMSSITHISGGLSLEVDLCDDQGNESHRTHNSSFKYDILKFLEYFREYNEA